MDLRGNESVRAGVLHVIASDARRGAEVFAVALAASLQDELPGVVVALQKGHGDSWLDVPTLGDTWWTLSTLRGLRQRMKEASVVVAHGSATLPAVVCAGVGLPVPRIYTSIGDPWFWSRTWRRRLQTTLLLRQIDLVTVLSPRAAQAVADCWRVSPAKIRITGNGRDPDDFRPPEPEERARARVELGLLSDGPTVVTLGALSREKRPLLAIAAINRLPGVTLLVAGDGPLRAEAEKAAAANPLIRILGPCADVVPILHAADALLLTSETEGLPGVLIEAGLTGLPCVTTRTGFVSDVVKDGETGVVVADPTPDELATGVRKVLDLHHEMSCAARQHCVAHFSIHDVRRRWLELLRQTATLRD